MFRRWFCFCVFVFVVHVFGDSWFCCKPSFREMPYSSCHAPSFMSFSMTIHARADFIRNSCCATNTNCCISLGVNNNIVNCIYLTLGVWNWPFLNNVCKNGSFHLELTTWMNPECCHECSETVSIKWSIPPNIVDLYIFHVSPQCTTCWEGGGGGGGVVHNKLHSTLFQRKVHSKQLV